MYILSFKRMMIVETISCALAEGNSACGKKEGKPCGTLVHTVAWVASRHKAREEGTNGRACEHP